LGQNRCLSALASEGEKDSQGAHRNHLRQQSNSERWKSLPERVPGEEVVLQVEGGGFAMTILNGSDGTLFE